MKRLVWYFIVTIIFSSFSRVIAGPLLPEQVPEPLQPWISWVLHDNQDYKCPFLYNSYQQKRCSWPSRLTLELNINKGRFNIDWKVYQDSWVQLPGDIKHWPLNVTVNDEKALVMKKQGKPVIKLDAGTYQINGEFLWDFIPDNLSIPEDTGLIKLSINNKSIENPAIKAGQIWLKESDSGNQKTGSIQNKLDLQVFRKILDEIPLRIITRFELEVSGDQREVKLAYPLLHNFIPMRLQSPLPARIEPDGSLLVQIRPGRWQIELTARHPEQLKQLTFNSSDPDWPDAEIWVFAARPYLRVVEIENINAVDPSQTNLPDRWKNLPAYRIKQGETMGFKIIRRGDPEPEPDQLNLTRKLWLDFDGNGYTINDKITGRMTQNWRLNALPETGLGKVELDGKSQLITRLPNDHQQGVEVRKGDIQLNADSRNTASITTMSAVGWAHDFHQVNAELNLPPGWRLLAASGIDNVPASWISRWTLLDLFIVLIAALAIARLWHLYWGIFALLTLVVIWHEPDAPRWVWLNIVAATALIKVLPQGKFLLVMRWYRNASWLALVLLAVPFIVAQVRMGLYPQLERPWQQIMAAQYDQLQTAQIASSPVAMEEKVMRKSASKMRSLAGAPGSVSDYSADKQVDYDRIDPNATVQTGPGLPQWQWNKIHLSWNGPVDSQQQLRFWYLTPTMTMLLNFIRVALVAILALLMFGVINRMAAKKSSSPLLFWLMLLPFMMLPAQDVFADYPDQDMLQELNKRLLEMPDCLPDCADISQMSLNINEREISIKLQIHAQKSVAVPLPVDAGQWFPNRASVNEKPAEALYRSNAGRLWINLVPGPQTVELRGEIPPRSQFTLPLPLKPKHVTIINRGWTIIGLHEHGNVDKQLQFNRIKTVVKDQSAKKILEPVTLPPFVSVERTLRLGLDWRIHTRIIRVSPIGTAIVLAIPLLSGESVTTAGLRIKDEKILVNMPSGQTVMQWDSALQKSPQIELTAVSTDQWTEVWRVDTSPVWHIQSSGIAVVHHQDRQGHWMPEWRPWPGEKIIIEVTRPEAVEGQSLTIDKSRLQITPGKRSLEAALNFTIRSSQGTQHNINLPEQAVLQSVSINGKTQPIRQKGNQLSLPVIPGKQEIAINWREPSEIASMITTPILNLGLESVNSTINVVLGEDRWLLLTWGPRFGPAILFWGVLFVIVLISMGLGRIRLTPLIHWQWLLLLIGISQIPVESAIVVVAWLMALGFRAEKQLNKPAYFNTVQVALGVLTLVALMLLFVAVEQGLLGSPDMQITGNHSSAYKLNWYQDRSPPVLPTATVISVPLMIYRILMLAWSLWLAVSLLNWLKWGWQCFSTNGLWKPIRKKVLSPENSKGSGVKSPSEGV